MSWFSEPANETEAGKAAYHMFLAVDLDFPSGHSRFWSGVGDLQIDGNTYIGAGELGRTSVVQERTTLSFDKKTYQLSGVDPALVSESDIDASFGRSTVEYFGFIDPETRELVADPEINYEGRIDSVRRVDGDEPVIEVSAEHRLVLLDRADDWMYTHEHQQQFFAGDRGFDQVPALELKEVEWGGKRAVVGWTGAGRARQPIYG